MEIQKRLLDVYFNECLGMRPDRSKDVYGLSSCGFARLNDLSRQTYQEFLVAAAKQVQVVFQKGQTSIYFKTDEIEKILSRYWLDDKECDDATLLLMFDAPRRLIQKLTGVHVTELTKRRAVLGITHEPRYGREKELEPDELRQIVKIWNELHEVRIVMRLVTIHTMTGMSIKRVYDGLVEMHVSVDSRDPVTLKAV